MCVHPDACIRNCINDLFFALVVYSEEQNEPGVVDFRLEELQLVVGCEYFAGTAVQEGPDVVGGGEGCDVDVEDVAVEVGGDVGEGLFEGFWGYGDEDLAEVGECCFGETGGGFRAEGINCSYQRDRHCVAIVCCL